MDRQDSALSNVLEPLLSHVCFCERMRQSVVGAAAAAAHLAGSVPAGLLAGP